MARPKKSENPSENHVDALAAHLQAQLALYNNPRPLTSSLMAAPKPSQTLCPLLKETPLPRNSTTPCTPPKRGSQYHINGAPRLDEIPEEES